MTTNELATVLEAASRHHAEKAFGANEAIALIAAVVALGALIVACLARLDSKKSADAAQHANDLVARQLELSVSERDRQLKKKVSESRPSLVWQGGMGGGDGLQCTREFQNVGGEIKNLSVETDNKDISASINPPTFLGQNGQGAVSFTSSNGQRITSFVFTITSTTKMEDRFNMSFKAVHEHGVVKISAIT